MTSEARTSNTQTALNALRELIFSGALSPGSNHLESDLAAKLGMSRTPVREAAVMLQAQGLLEIQPRRGLRILGLSVEDMREIYDILIELEGLATARAAKARHPPEALRAMRDSIDQMERALARQDSDAWAIADETFHSELVRLSGNRHLKEMVDRVVDKVRRARSLTLHFRPLPTQSTADHRAVMDAIAQGDAETARQRHAAHRTETSKLMTELLSQIGRHQI